MERTFAFLGATLGGFGGWVVGSPLSPYAGMFASLVGTGLGIWFARRIVRDYF